MVAASLAGFCVSAQFVSLIGLEIPYYVGLIGIGALKLNSAHEAQFAAGDYDHDDLEQSFDFGLSHPLAPHSA
jgi:hypothetical protein